MPVRPDLQESTVSKLNAKVQDAMAVDPKEVSIDQRIRVLMAELEELKKEKENQKEIDAHLEQIRRDISNIERSVDNPNTGY
jgi:hypothetical protein